MTAPRTIRIGLLICGNMTGSVADIHGNYQEIYTDYFRSTTPRNNVAKIDIESFIIRNMEFPDESRLDDYDIFVITGSGIILPIHFWGIEVTNSRSSADSAYEDTIPWIKKLRVFLKDLIENHINVKICGKLMNVFANMINNRTVAHQVYALDIKSSVVYSAANVSLVDSGKLALLESI